MSLTRRAAARGVLGAATLGLLHAPGARAQAAWPERTVTIVVPYPPGGSTDTVARILAQRMASDLGKPVVVDNRAGAAGTVGAAGVARARPDGHTLLFAPAGVYAMAPHLYQLPYDNDRAFSGVGLVASMPMFLAVSKELPARNLRELVELAKGGQRIVFANPGAGSSSHLAAELLMQTAGFEVSDVGYRGGAPAVQAVMTNEAQMIIMAASGVLPQMQSGDVRALAVTTRERSTFAPDVPTVAEAGFPGYEVPEELALLAPAGVPEAVLKQINAAVAAAMNAPEVQSSLKPLAVVPTVTPAEAFPAYFTAENAKWRDVIRSRNIRVQ
ncbi:Tat pathway signal sequence domain protein [Acetobacteraceae bacterium AT-5844]|nr:Tat pathway signal sequence domain protein [Acetobacteraceae bacterium AT-5844]